MKNPTELKIWQAAYDGVMAQGALAADAFGCHYRLDGLKCGVGHLITDEEAVKLDDWPIIDSITQGDAPEWMTDFPLLLGAVQLAHDNAKDLEEFARRMTKIKPEATS